MLLDLLEPIGEALGVPAVVGADSVSGFPHDRADIGGEFDVFVFEGKGRCEQTCFPPGEGERGPGLVCP